MADAANVKATDSIERFRAALAVFAKQSGDGLSEIEGEVRRTLDWIEHDRPRYWKERVRRAFDEVGQAKGDLHRCLMYNQGLTERPSCAEQRAELKKAQARLVYCEQKQERLGHWAREVHHELHEDLGRVASFKQVLEGDIPEAAAVLGRLLTSIEAYTQGTVTVSRSEPSGGETNSSPL